MVHPKSKRTNAKLQKKAATTEFFTQASTALLHSVFLMSAATFRIILDEKSDRWDTGTRGTDRIVLIFVAENEPSMVAWFRMA